MTVLKGGLARPQFARYFAPIVYGGYTPVDEESLDLKGVAVSGGSACHSGATEPSHVLMAMGLDKPRARASLRFSLLKTATEDDVDYVLGVVPAAVERLRALSPVEAGTLG